MRRLVTAWTLGVLGLLAGGALAGFLPYGWCPDAGLLLVVIVALRAPGVSGCLAAWGIGWVTDLLSGAPLGQYASLRLLAWATTRLADHQLNLRRPVLQVGFVALLTCADAFALAGLARLVGQPAAFGLPLVGILLPHALANAATLLVVDRAVAWSLARLGDREGTRPALRLPAGPALP